MKKEAITLQNFWQVLLRSAAASFFSWRVVAKELIGIGLIWCAYFIAHQLIGVSGAPATIMPAMFWPSVVISGISFALVSLKSILPAVLVLIAIIPLGFLGFYQAMNIASVIAVIGVWLYVIGFVLFGASPTWFRRK